MKRLFPPDADRRNTKHTPEGTGEMGGVGKAARIGSFGQAITCRIRCDREFKTQPEQVGPEPDAGFLKEQMAETFRGKVYGSSNFGHGDRLAKPLAEYR